MEQNKRSYLLPVLLAFAMAIGLFLGNWLTPPKEANGYSDESMKYEKLNDVLEVLDRKYVDDVNGNDLFEQTIEDMLHRLDPHSNYISAKDLKRVNEDIQGKFGGVGIRFFIIRDTVCVTNVLPNSPSMRAGVKAGDKILKVDNTPIAGKNITNARVMELLKGQEGKKVDLSLLRAGAINKKTVIRGSIPVESVIASYIIRGSIGYIKIDRFSIETAREFRTAVYELKSKGMKQLILDLP